MCILLLLSNHRFTYEKSTTATDKSTCAICFQEEVTCFIDSCGSSIAKKVILMNRDSENILRSNKLIQYA